MYYYFFWKKMCMVCNLFMLLQDDVNNAHIGHLQYSSFNRNTKGTYFFYVREKHFSKHSNLLKTRSQGVYS